MIDLTQIKPEIESICNALPVKRLAVFGSALSDSFGSTSDIDVLVVFDRDMHIDLFAKYFELKESLEKIFNRQVDLTVDKHFKNPIFRNSVEKTRTVIYER
jgi:uncharacterized protein